MQDQQLDGPTERSEQSPIWVHDPRSIELRGQWPDAEVTSSNEISRVFLEGSTAAAAGGSALTESGPFGGLLTDRAPAGCR